MNIFHPDGTILVDQVDDRSYRSKAIRGDNALTIYFSSPEHIEVPVGAWTVFQEERYELLQPENLKKLSRRNFEYTLIMDAEQGKLKRFRFRDLVYLPNTKTFEGSRRLKFSYTAKPIGHLQMLIDNLNFREGGWTIGEECVDAVEQVLSYNHTTCWDALNQIADAFNTEWEIIGKTIYLKKVEYNKDITALPLSYGKGNGFKPGLGRSNYENSNPIEVLFVQGGERNIDPSTYGNSELLLPRSTANNPKIIEYEGRQYVTDEEGLSIRRYDKAQSIKTEDSLDLSHIYPSRVGTVSEVFVVAGEEGDLYDFIDKDIPDDLDYEKCRIAGEPMTVIFQDGMLAGKEFDVNYFHDDRRFEIVPQTIDGRLMPDNFFTPVEGGKYAIFGIMMPKEYIENNDQTGASWDMFREAVQYFYEHEDPHFSFIGELDGIWAKHNWDDLGIGGKIRLGGYVSFTDNQFQPEPVLIRIIGIKDYINNPYSPTIELSNYPVGGSVSSHIKKIEQNEVVTENLVKESVQYSKRRFHDVQETFEMMFDVEGEYFTDKIKPLVVETAGVMVGTNSQQFNLMGVRFKPNYEGDANRFLSTAGRLIHFTILDGNGNPREWNILSSDTALNPEDAYYVYARCAKETKTGEILATTDQIKLEQVAGYFHFLIGILNTPINESTATTRSWAPTYGYTEITGETITSGVIKSADGDTYFDLKNNKIGGNIHFEDGLFSGLIEVGAKKGETNSGINGENDSEDPVRFWAGSDAQNKANAPFRVTHGGKLIADEAEIQGKFESDKNGNRIVIDPLSRNIQLIDPERGLLGVWSFFGTGSILSIMHKLTTQEEEMQLKGNSISFSTKNSSGKKRYSNIGMYGMDFDIDLFPTVNNLNDLAIGAIYRDGNVLKMKIQD